MSNSLKAKALAYLSRREYTFLELFNKLKRYSDSDSEIKDVLTELVKHGYLSEERYIKSYLHSKSHKNGLLKIKYNLIQKTANPQLVEQIISEVAIDEEQVAKELLAKKFAKVATTTEEKAKQSRFLQSKGFSFSVIRRVI